MANEAKRNAAGGSNDVSSVERAGGIAVDGRQRVIVERVSPEIDGGRHPVKRIVGETFVVDADVFVDGHDLVAGALLYRRSKAESWREAPLKSLGNDRFRASFVLAEVGRWQFTLEAWVDTFATWRKGLAK